MDNESVDVNHKVAHFSYSTTVISNKLAIGHVLNARRAVQLAARFGDAARSPHVACLRLSETGEECSTLKSPRQPVWATNLVCGHDGVVDRCGQVLTAPPYDRTPHACGHSGNLLFHYLYHLDNVTERSLREASRNQEVSQTSPFRDVWLTSWFREGSRRLLSVTSGSPLGFGRPLGDFFP